MANVRMFERKVAARASATPPPGVLGSLVESSALGAVCVEISSRWWFSALPRGVIFFLETHKPFVRLWRRGESLVPQNYRYQLVYKYYDSVLVSRDFAPHMVSSFRRLLNLRRSSSPPPRWNSALLV